MTPISPQNYKGIVYVQLDRLPQEQFAQLTSWLPATERIKLRIGEKIVDGCVKYRDYIFWYENYYYHGESFESEI